jgi:hypothetical protein
MSQARFATIRVDCSRTRVRKIAPPRGDISPSAIRAVPFDRAAVGVMAHRRRSGTSIALHYQLTATMAVAGAQRCSILPTERHEACVYVANGRAHGWMEDVTGS